MSIAQQMQIEISCRWLVRVVKRITAESKASASRMKKISAEEVQVLL